MTERTQHDDAAPGSPDPKKVHTFDLIDEVPGVSAGAAGPDDAGDEPVAEPDPEEAAPREPGRVARAVTAARGAVGRTARRGAAAVRRRVPATRRGRVLLVGGVAAAVVLAVVAGALLDAQLRHRDLIAAPGGVRSLAERPAEQWSIDLDNPIASTLVEMPGVLAVIADGTVQGVDPESGAVRWTVDVGEGARCGPTPWLGIGGPATTMPADPLVCVTTSEGGQAEQGVTVVDADGAVTTRELDPGTIVLPGSDGALIRLQLAGDGHGPEPVVVDKVGTPHLPKGFTAPDLTVRVEDAVTGTERWSATVASGRPDPNYCLTYHQEVDDDSPTPVLDVEGVLNANLQQGILEIEGCGVSAAFLLDGTRLDDPDDATDLTDATAAGQFTALPGGGWVGPDPAAGRVDETGRPSQVVHLPDGRTVPLDGRVLVPWSTDGRDPGLLLVRAGVHTEAVSTDERDAGSRLWTSSPRLRATDLLASVGGTAVVVDELGPVRAVDLGTGAVRWTLDPEVLGFEEGVWDAASTIFGAYTDGDVLLLPVTADPQGGTSGLRLVAVDLRDGSVRWEIEQETPYTQIVSVDGYLAQITQHGVVGLG
ncbi:PQQ-binding-like beta-propeller repeat protein [Promicromonospora sp. MS192]|uniref:outer membrane protein assembly factor BamB family protein n=1 Tax=Promicromonospora sp. MS192 TaxID=3412684 RepID=UPI003C2D2383